MVAPSPNPRANRVDAITMHNDFGNKSCSQRDPGVDHLSMDFIFFAQTIVSFHNDGREGSTANTYQKNEGE